MISTRMKKKQQTGFTWVSTLIVLLIVGGLFTQGAYHWKVWRVRQMKRVLFHDIERALAFARNTAFLRGETLILSPSNTENNWALAIKLQTQNKQSVDIHAWQWHFKEHVQLTWHGFLGQDKLIISHRAESLAMNGYFILEGPFFSAEKWVVNRFGRIKTGVKLG